MINYNTLNYEDQVAKIDLNVWMELGDHSYEEVKVNLNYLLRILDRLQSLKETDPEAVAVADVPETKKYIMDFYAKKKK